MLQTNNIFTFKPFISAVTLNSCFGLSLCRQEALLKQSDKGKLCWSKLAHVMCWGAGQVVVVLRFKPRKGGACVCCMRYQAAAHKRVQKTRHGVHACMFYSCARRAVFPVKKSHLHRQTHHVMAAKKPKTHMAASAAI